MPLSLESLDKAKEKAEQYLETDIATLLSKSYFEPKFKTALSSDLNKLSKIFASLKSNIPSVSAPTAEQLAYKKTELKYAEITQKFEILRTTIQQGLNEYLKTIALPDSFKPHIDTLKKMYPREDGVIETYAKDPQWLFNFVNQKIEGLKRTTSAGLSNQGKMKDALGKLVEDLKRDPDPKAKELSTIFESLNKELPKPSAPKRPLTAARDAGRKANTPQTASDVTPDKSKPRGPKT